MNRKPIIKFFLVVLFLFFLCGMYINSSTFFRLKLANHYKKTHNYAKLIAVYKKILRKETLSPKHQTLGIEDISDTRFTLSNLLLARDKFTESAQLLSEIVKSNPAYKLGCLIVSYYVNADYIPKSHWVFDKDIGGGRIRGEACHMIDFLNWFIDEKIIEVKYEFLNSGEFYDQDNLVLTLKYNDRSIGNLIYTTIGHQKFSKEYITILKNQNQIIIDDFEKININERIEKSKQDKGSLKELEEFAKKIKGGKSLILDEIDAFKVTELIDKLK